MSFDYDSPTLGAWRRANGITDDQIRSMADTVTADALAEDARSLADIIESELIPDLMAKTAVER